MNTKKPLLFFLIGTLFLIFISGFVSAGCCLYETLGSSCEVSPNIGNCSTVPKNFTNSACSQLGECDVGCCCPYENPSGTGSTNYSCKYPSTFIKNPAVNIGLTCSCGGGAYSVSGIVTDLLANPLGAATVSALGAAPNTSRSDGSYFLSGVTGGTNVQIKASKDNCLPSSTIIPNLNSDVTGLTIQLNCVCSPGTCNATSNARCEGTNQWRVYIFPAEKDLYCSLCRHYDPIDCPQVNVCVGGDSSCPLVCSNVPGSNYYDSDCVCSPTPNNVCPSWLGCNEITADPDYDADCTAAFAQCGNHIIEYPYETCEEGVFGMCSDADCANPGETGECNCQGLRCGNLILDPGEDCEIGMVCADGKQCENCQCGPPTCTPATSTPRITSSFDSANSRVLVSWSVQSSCMASIHYSDLFRCEKKTGSPCTFSSGGFDAVPVSPILSPTMNYSDVLISGDSEYCYYVTVTYTDRPQATSNITCIHTGDDTCLNPHTKEFCLYNMRYECDANQNLHLIEDCNPDRHCMPPDRNEITRCVNQSVCDLCNGLYGMFANLPDIRIKIQGTAGYEFRWCKPSTTYRPLVDGCYLDRTKTLFSSFKYCDNVETCYDYKSEDVCENSDTCDGKTGPCEWVWLQSGKPELGGICRPTQKELQKCEFCDQEEYNWLSPGCTPEVCRLFGQCYYLGTGTWRTTTATCSEQSILSCLDYDNVVDCIGGNSVKVDATYTNDIRTGGTHQLTPSNDALKLGKCYWMDFGGGFGACHRDADNYPIVSYGSNVGFDCNSTDLFCESDFGNPVTTILPRSGCYAGGVYSADLSIKYRASDNRYAANQLKTYFCIAPQGSSCYPDELGFNGAYTETMSSSGTYNLYYYSEDPAKNLEFVNHTLIEVDTVLPVIDFISPNDVNVTLTNQPELLVIGNTTLDAMFVCGRNTKTNKTVCQSSCAIPNIKPPCIENGTGIFSMKIPLSPNINLTDIILYSQDRACNAFVSNALSIILDIEPPTGPKINISHYYT